MAEQILGQSYLYWRLLVTVYITVPVPKKKEVYFRRRTSFLSNLAIRMEAKNVTREGIENLVKEINKTYPVYPKNNIPLDFHLELKINGDTVSIEDSDDLFYLKSMLDDHVLKDSVGHHGFILDSQHIIYMYDIDIDTKKPFLIVNLK